MLEELNKNYNIDVIEIEKNDESTVGNVYIIKTTSNKYVAKVYDDIKHTTSMIKLHDDLISKKIYVPKIIMTTKGSKYITLDNKYLVLYSFIDGKKLSDKFNNIPDEVIVKLAKEIRRFHNETIVNIYDLNNIPYEEYNVTRKSALHFDLTRSNIFYNDDNIGFIDFDDAKYGPSICDVSIAVAIIFFSKKRGVDLHGMNIFINAYYQDDLKLKENEIKYLKVYALNWIDFVMSTNEFNNSVNESFIIKRKLIEENLN